MITDARQVGTALLGKEYRLEFNGYSPALVNKFKLGKRSFEEVELNGGAQTLAVYQAGGEKLDTWSAEVILPAENKEAILFWQNWQDQVRTRNPKLYYRDFTAIAIGPEDNPAFTVDVEDGYPQEAEFEEWDADDGKKRMTIKITGRCNNWRIRA